MNIWTLIHKIKAFRKRFKSVRYQDSVAEIKGFKRISFKETQVLEFSEN